LRVFASEAVQSGLEQFKKLAFLANYRIGEEQLVRGSSDRLEKHRPHLAG